jgi:hypothetical protein
MPLNPLNLASHWAVRLFPFSATISQADAFFDIGILISVPIDRHFRRVEKPCQFERK